MNFIKEEGYGRTGSSRFLYGTLVIDENYQTGGLSLPAAVNFKFLHSGYIQAIPPDGNEYKINEVDKTLMIFNAGSELANATPLDVTLRVGLHLEGPADPLVDRLT